MTRTRYDEVCEDLINSPRRWLVTGVAGFIGSALLERLLDLGQTVVGVDNFLTGHKRNIDDVLSINPDEKLQFQFIEGDLRDPEVAKRACSEVDIVLHQAALGSVPRSIKDPIASHQHNVDAFLNVLWAAKEGGVKRVVYASSSSVYGNSTPLPAREDSPAIEPESPYAASKRGAELVSLALARRTPQMSVAGLRFFTVYGPRQRPEMAITLFTRKALKNEPIAMFGDGSMKRDFTHVDDVAPAVITILGKPLQGLPPHAVYNIGNSTPCSVLELIALIEQSTGVAAKRVVAPMQKGDVHVTCADISRAAAKVGYKPLRYDGLKKVLLGLTTIEEIEQNTPFEWAT